MQKCKSQRFRQHVSYTGPDGRQYMVFNRTRPGNYIAELDSLPGEIHSALEAGDLEVDSALSRQTNRIVLCTTGRELVSH